MAGPTQPVPETFNGPNQPLPASKELSSPPRSNSNMSIKEEGFDASAILSTLADSFNQMSADEKKATIKKTNGIFLLNVKNKEGKEASWTIDLKKDGEVVKGAKGKADVTINLDDSTFVGLADGSLNSQKMFMQGKLKVKGNVMLAVSACSPHLNS
ncbi:SCP2 sterol-binding domain-containing protein [Mrakia frigida]|uniref:SCP2 sterol-binding domain-containing protein n=1 Tax=Mrakia frigida TaxID=29902 RepID=UPI003FCC1D08